MTARWSRGASGRAAGAACGGLVGHGSLVRSDPTMVAPRPPGHDPTGPWGSYPDEPWTIPCRGGAALLSRPRRERDVGQYGPVRQRPADPGRDGDRHRPAAPPSRGRTAGLPPRRPDGTRRGHRRPLVRRPRREPGGGRTRARRMPRWCCSAIRSIRPVLRRRPMPGSPTGRRSVALSCCSPASRIRSPGSSCCGPPSACWRTRNWSPTRGSGTRSSPSCPTFSTARRRSCEECRAPDRSSARIGRPDRS